MRRQGGGSANSTIGSPALGADLVTAPPPPPATTSPAGSAPPPAAASTADLAPRARPAECDLDGDKRLDAKELHVALLILYAKINEKLPEGVRIPAPSHAQVKVVLATADVDKDGHLSKVRGSAGAPTRSIGGRSSQNKTATAS